jgi:cyclic beta-1,2-glucan synthetase
MALTSATGELIRDEDGLIRLLWPPFDLTPRDPGYSRRMFSLLNPIHHEQTRDHAKRYLVEPYVIAADVASVPPHVGRGGWTWYTGSAAWTWRLGLEGILGCSCQMGI